MSNPKVAFLHGLNKPILDWVMAHVPDDFSVTAVDGKLSEAEIMKAVNPADFLMIYRAEPSDALLKSSPKIKLIQLLAAGYETMNLKLMRELNMPCAQNAGANSWAVADHAVLLMLAVYRRLVLCDRSTRAGRWREPVSGMNTFEMDGKLVGIFGIGNVGSKVAKRVQGFGAKVQYFDKFPLKPEREKELDVKKVSIEDLFRTSDIVTLHTPLTDETNRMINKTLLSTMKPAAVIINTSRGEIIDERALADAVKEGKILGAGLDVFDKEPPDPGNPLLALDNVVVTPHSAGTTLDTWGRRLDFAFGNMRRVLKGDAPVAVVNAS
jgi:phosphoglycerate dehydrogenase-like enzyme